MKKIFVLAAGINIIVGIVGFLLFAVLGGFDFYLGKGSPVWLCWIPSIFFIGSVFNFLSAFLDIKNTRIIKNKASTNKD